MAPIEYSQSSKEEDAWIPSTCYMCVNACGILAHRINGVIVKIEGDAKNPTNLGKLCAKGNSGLMSLYNPSRVLKPLKRTKPKMTLGADAGWVEISWEEALNTIAERLRKVKAKDPRKLLFGTFDYCATNVLGAFLTAFGTPNMSYLGACYFCGNGVHPPDYLYHGNFDSEPDLARAKYVLLVGTQFGFVSHHIPMHNASLMADARMRGMKLVVVDPICTNAASKADEWVPIRPGTDTPFALSIINVLVNELGIYDRDFLLKETNGPYLAGSNGRYVRDSAGKPLIWDLADEKPKAFDEHVGTPALEGAFKVDGEKCKTTFQLLKEHVKDYTPEMVSTITTVPSATIRRIARDLGEYAQIGSTITIDGTVLTYRPASVDWYRGPSAHEHGLAAGYALGLINVVIGACDVPGGHLGTLPVGPWWNAKESNEGLMIPNDDTVGHVCDPPYPARRVSRPESITAFELFPVAVYSDPILVEVMKNPDKFGLYVPEVFMVTKSNPIASLANPKDMFDVFKKIPFTVLFTTEKSEVMDIADIVLPDAHYLERFDFLPNAPYFGMPTGQGDWYWQIRQAVVNPPLSVRYWIDVMIDLAEKIGITGDFNELVNFQLQLKDEYKLSPEIKYDYEEMCDRFLKSKFGEEHGIDYFRKVGVHIIRKRTVDEAFPRSKMARIPVYQEHLINAGEEVKKVTREMGLSWDTHDYTPIPKWIPCGEWSSKGDRDLFAISYHLPYLTHSRQGNPWLHQLKEASAYARRIMINRATAKKKGLKDGDMVALESGSGYVTQGRIVATELVHPEVAAIGGNFRKSQEIQNIRTTENVHWNPLLNHTLERIDKLGGSLDSCIRVKITKTTPQACLN